ncbi:hypothetical protein SESBI_18389 [Sesbania bispinosa]|nr:hypothetical protein SESBI_18389 [Sesbania bispinosa]
MAFMKSTIPGLEILLRGLVIGINGLNMLLAVLNDLCKDPTGDVGQRDVSIKHLSSMIYLVACNSSATTLVHLEHLFVRTL